MEKSYLTTTEAAKLLSVSSDTVLKWVKAGKIQFYRTPGGHCRIPIDAVTTLLPGGPHDSAEERAPGASLYEYCWEFNANAAGVKLDCHDCLVYKSRAKRCYELKDLREEIGTLTHYCTSSCTECEYYQLVKDRGPSVLIITGSDELTKNLMEANNQSYLQLKFAQSEYECAAVIENFRPDYVVVDWSLGSTKTTAICRHLSDDSRIPLTRIILTSKSRKAQDYCDQEIFGWLKRPFTLAQLRSCLGQLELGVQK